MFLPSMSSVLGGDVCFFSRVLSAGEDVVTLNAVSCGWPWLLALELFLVLGQMGSALKKNGKTVWECSVCALACPYLFEIVKL